MSTRSSVTRLWAILLFFAPLNACDNEPAISPPPADTGPGIAPDGQPAPNDTYRLSIIGSASLTLKPKEQATLKVGYMKNETNLPGKAITFAIKGDAKDTALTTLIAITDSLGVAQTTVAAGEMPASFLVEASAFQAAPVNFSIQVVSGPPPVPKLAGVFTIVSNFDVSTQFTGTTLADVLNVLDEMSNHPDDPGRFIVDIIFNEAFKSLDPTIQKAVSLFKPLLYSEVQKLLMQFAPTIVTDVKTIAKNISDLARRFQVTSNITSTTEQPSDKPMVVSHKLEKIGWTLNGKKKEYSYADLGLQHPQADKVQLVVSKATALSISQHSFPLQFGSFLLVGVNQLVIPLVNPSASSFSGLLAGWIDCVSVGKTINNSVGMLGEAFWKSACDVALQAMGGLIEQQITQINVGKSSLSIAGSCQITDQNNDVYLDFLSSGLWTGTFTLGSNVAPIGGAGNNFAGTRTK